MSLQTYINEINEFEHRTNYNAHAHEHRSFLDMNIVKTYYQYICCLVNE